MDEHLEPDTKGILELSGFYKTEKASELAVIDIAMPYTLCEDCREPVIKVAEAVAGDRPLCRACDDTKLRTYLAALERGFRIG